jgi:flagellar biosynthesis/type III secretory pathway M-ring protein FliF/YscJ
MDNPIPRFERLQRALAELSPARRMIAGTLIAAILATAVWTAARFASSSARDAAGRTMLPVLDQRFSQTELERIARHLDAKKIGHEIDADEGRVLVRADQRLEVLSDLFYAGVLGGGASNEGAFDALVKQMTAWDPPSKTDKMFNRYREEKVEEVISRYPGVRKTTVIIDPTNERRLGGESVQPAAMVDIQTRGDGSADPRQLSQAAANVLTGVIANLPRDRVRVTIDGATFNSDGANGSSGDLVARKHQCEQMHVAKVRQLLSYIPGDVLVSVSVDLDVPTVDAEPAEASAKRQAEGEVVANAVPQVAEAAKHVPVHADVVPDRFGGGAAELLRADLPQGDDGDAGADRRAAPAHRGRVLGEDPQPGEERIGRRER